MFDDEMTDDPSSMWASDGKDAAASGGDASGDTSDAYSGPGGAPAEAADLFAGQYDDDGGAAPAVAAAMGQPGAKEEYPWPPPPTMSWWQSGIQKAGEWIFDTLSDPFGFERRAIDERKVEHAQRKYGPSPAPAPGANPIQPPPPQTIE
jgi:hypothetical protein